MPIDPTPDGPGILNPPVEKPFPETPDKPDDSREEAPNAKPVDDNDDRVAKASEDLAATEQGLPHGAMAEQQFAKPLLGN